MRTELQMAGAVENGRSVTDCKSDGVLAGDYNGVVPQVCGTRLNSSDAEVVMEKQFNLLVE